MTPPAHIDNLLEDLGLMVDILAPNGDVSYANRAWRELLGYSEADLPRLNIFDIIHPDSLPLYREAFLNCLRQPSLQQIRVDLRSKQNSRLAFQVFLDGRRREGTPAGLRCHYTPTSDLREDEINSLLAFNKILVTALDFTADGVLVVDLKGRVVLFNRHFQTLWNIPDRIVNTRDDRQLLEYAVGQLVEPEAFVRTVETLYESDRCIANEEIQLKDGRTIERDSAPHWMDGKIVGRVWSFRDITAHKKAEAAALRSKKQFDYALDVSRDGFWDWNIETGHVNYSPQWMELLGYTAADVPANVEFAFSLIHPDDLDRVNEHIRNHHEGHTPVFEVDVRMRNKGGEYRWFWARGKVIQRLPDGGPRRMAGAITDITDAVRISEELRKTQFSLDHAPDAVFWLDPDGRITYANEQACRELKYTREQLLSLTVFDISADLTPAVWTARSRQRRAGRKVEFESFWKTSEGSVAPVEVSTTQLRYEGKDYTCSFVRSIEARKQLETALRVISTRLTGVQDEEYFRQAATQCAEILKVDVAFISRWKASEPDVMTPLSFIVDGQPV